MSGTSLPPNDTVPLMAIRAYEPTTIAQPTNPLLRVSRCGIDCYDKTIANKGWQKFSYILTREEIAKRFPPPAPVINAVIKLELTLMWSMLVVDAKPSGNV